MPEAVRQMRQMGCRHTALGDPTARVHRLRDIAVRVVDGVADPDGASGTEKQRSVRASGTLLGKEGQSPGAVFPPRLTTIASSDHAKLPRNLRAFSSFWRNLLPVHGLR